MARPGGGCRLIFRLGAAGFRPGIVISHSRETDMSSASGLGRAVRSVVILSAASATSAGAASAVYWSDFHNGAIYRTAGPGAAHELVVPDAGGPWGIAVDPINRHLYWGDNDASSARKITRSNY